MSIVSASMASRRNGSNGTGAAGASLRINDPNSVTFVLVHGAWHGGWCWWQVADRLRAAGHTVYTPTLTGLGERAHLRSPIISLETHVSDIAGVIESEELSGVVLVGHSYGGTVITGVAARLPHRISTLVYLDPILPSPGNSIIDHATEEQVKLTASRAIDGYLVPALDARAFGIPEWDRELIEWTNRRLTPHPLRTLLEPLLLPNHAWPKQPKTYIRCTKPYFEIGIEMDLESIRAHPEWNWIELETGHNAMMIAPDAVTAILLAGVASETISVSPRAYGSVG